MHGYELLLDYTGNTFGGQHNGRSSVATGPAQPTSTRPDPVATLDRSVHHKIEFIRMTNTACLIDRMIENKAQSMSTYVTAQP